MRDDDECIPCPGCRLVWVGEVVGTHGLGRNLAVRWGETFGSAGCD